VTAAAARPGRRVARGALGPVAEGGRLVAAGVTYLNGRPAIDPLERGRYAERFVVGRAASAEVARRVAEGEAALGLMPVAAYADLGGLELVPGVAIGAKGPVRSVLLLADEPLDRLDTIVLDATSRTSVVLARLVVAARRKAPVRYACDDPQGAVDAVGGKTGAVVIGDVALRNEGRCARTIDLGAAWLEMTGLPFVFAAWCAPAGVVGPGDAELLRAALAEGLADRAAIARDYARATGDDEARARNYLTEAVRYEFGDLEREGLQLFFDRAAAAGLLPPARVRFVEGRPTSGGAARPHGAAGATEAGGATGANADGAGADGGAGANGAGAWPGRPSIDALLSRAAEGGRLSGEEAERLYAEAPLFELGLAADEVRRRRHPDGVVTYIVDRNINYTNVCTTSCRFCAFYRPLGHAEAYVLSREVLAQKMREVVDAGGVQILLQGGLHPELGIGWYEDLFGWIKSNFPLGLHALSPEEIVHLSRLEGLPVREVLARLHAAGLDSLPGGGAEILTDRVRRKIAPAKCTSDEWLFVMREAHRLGLRSSATMMYGTTDVARDRVLHLLKLRALQDETGGFTAFFCWDYQYEKGVKQRAGETGTNYYLRTQALARLVLDNFEHVGASWVTQGPDVGEVALRFGADDFGSVMFEENVVSSAGTTYCIDAAAIERRIRGAGFKAVRRNVRYEWLGEPA
jgi:cyclic dehypoxanthinyl futalosine synthase